jgi:hypothetical protein
MKKGIGWLLQILSIVIILFVAFQTELGRKVHNGAEAVATIVAIVISIVLERVGRRLKRD